LSADAGPASFNLDAVKQQIDASIENKADSEQALHHDRPALSLQRSPAALAKGSVAHPRGLSSLRRERRQFLGARIMSRRHRRGGARFVAVPSATALADMIYVSGGTFQMGSDKHYPEEAPVHWVRVGSFWMDRTPVTNNDFRKFVHATGYVTVAEIKPDPKEY